MKCEYCGQEFDRQFSAGRKPKYCSVECRNENDKEHKRIQYVGKRETVCRQCGMELPKGKTRFCSNSCRSRYRAIQEGRSLDHGELTKTCVVCGKEFKTWKSRQVCCSSECTKYRANHKQLNDEQKRKRKEYDHQKWLKTHPDALTKKERDKVRHEQKLAREAKEAPEKERRRKEYEAKQREWAKIRAHKEAVKQANIAYWQEYEAEHECCVCGKKFIAYYPLTKYCSNTCKKRNQRVRDNRHRYKDITVDKGITLPKLAKRDHNQCQICGLFVDWNDYIETERTIICGDMYPSIDHIKPISLGGLHSWDNVQLAHRGCNTRKNNKYIG